MRRLVYNKNDSLKGLDSSTLVDTSVSEHVEQWKILLGNTWGPAVSKMVSQVAAIYTRGHVDSRKGPRLGIQVLSSHMKEKIDRLGWAPSPLCSRTCSIA